ncbi:hypothetical protein [Chromobacterium violaceum]|uniref:hypothetical protein n=1 Tax=Chromobacterium violaceum TaxID=536 RepID=UPI001CE21A24|nr:hypothetical protein [Chromobacterium violaceum]
MRNDATISGTGAAIDSRRTSHKASIGLIFLLLSGCAGIDRNAAKSLGSAGQSAASALAHQALDAQTQMESLPEWLETREALNCVNRPNSAAITSCLDGVQKRYPMAPPPSPAGTPVPPQVQIVTVLKARVQAANALADAYQAFINAAQYDAGSEVIKSMTNATTAVNNLAEAAKLLPGGASVISIPEDVLKGLTDAAGFIAEERQRQQLLAASKDLHKAAESLLSSLKVEKSAFESLVSNLDVEASTLYKSFVTAGMVDYREALTPLLHDIAPNATFVANPPKEYMGAIHLASSYSLTARAKKSRAQHIANYDAEIEALNATVEAHVKLENKQPLDISQIVAAVQRLRSVVQ